MRQATQGDLILGINALVAMREKNPNKQMRYADPDVAFRYLTYAASQGNVVVVDEYLILYSVVKPWFSDADFLVEDLILKIRPTKTPVEVCIDALEELKVMFKCVCVIAGDTQIGYMTPKYIAKGFEPLGVQLIKE